MFDFGFWELVLVAIVVLLVVGPDRLPRMARVAGRTIGDIRRFANDFRTQIENEADLKDPGGLKGELEEHGKTIGRLGRDAYTAGAPDELNKTIDQALESGRYTRDPSVTESGADESSGGGGKDADRS